MVTPFPVTLISGVSAATAMISKLYGSSSLSLLEIVIGPEYVHAVADEKLTTNVSDAPTARLATKVSLPSVKPLGSDGVCKVRVSVPAFFTVNVRDIRVFNSTVPKSVPSRMPGVLSPSTIVMPYPVTSISGVPFTTTRMSKLYGSLLLSLFEMTNGPEYVPAAAAEK